MGGPATAQLQDVKQFHDLATAGGMPFDFVSTHMYPTDPQLGKGVHWDPSGLIDHVKAARASVPDKPFYLTEYNVGCCIGYQGHDTSAAAAYAFRAVGALSGVVDILSWWCAQRLSAVCALCAPESALCCCANRTFTDGKCNSSLLCLFPKPHGSCCTQSSKRAACRQPSTGKILTEI